MKIINYEEKEMIPLTYEENKSYKEQEACHICEEKFCMDKDDENYTNRKKVKDHCHYTGKFRGAAHSKCNLMMVKQLHTSYGLLIVLDLCRLHYQNLLITCLEILIV